MTLDLRASSQLLGSYLHQDWPEEFDTDVAAVQAMLLSEPREVVVEACREIEDLLSSGLSDSELGKVLMDEAACYFDPGSKGQTYRHWLADVLRLLKAE